jgi:hypothetical protein
VEEEEREGGRERETKTNKEGESEGGTKR